MSYTTPRTRATVADGQLTWQDASGAVHTVRLDTPAWYAWLDDPASTSFRLLHPSGALSVRKERKQRGGWYWSAYRKVGGTLQKRYLGRGADLAAARLAQVAGELAGAHPAAAPDLPDAPLPAPLVRTKITLPPDPPATLPRERLLAMAASPVPSRLTLILAPAGSGKTTLLRELARRAPGPVAWLALDPADSDPARFWRYLAAALAAALPALRAPLAAVPRLAPHHAAEVVAAALAAALAGGRPLLLCLDDYHVVDAPGVHAGLDALLAHAPPGLHLAIASRVEPPLPLARLRAAGRLRLIHGDDLRFTADEARALLRAAPGAALTEDEVATLVAATEGWAAGLRLASLAIADGEPAAAVLARVAAGHGDLFDYLMAEVFARQPEAVRRFLLETAVLEQLTAELCDAVLEEPGRSAGILDALARVGLFLVPLDAERRWYRYHQLLAAFLRRRLAEGAPSLAAVLHRRAAAWYDARGDLEPAVRHLVRAGDPTAAGAVIERRLDALVTQVHALPALRAAIELLPDAVIRARPALALAHAMTLYGTVHMADLLPHRLREAVAAVPDDRLREAWAAGAAPPDDADQALRTILALVGLLETSVARVRPEAADITALEARTLAWLPPDAHFHATAFAYDRLTGAMVRGDLVGALALCQEAIQRATAHRYHDVALLAGEARGRALAWAGQLQRARAQFDRTARAGARVGIDPLALARQLRLGCGMLHYAANELPAALAALAPEVAAPWPWWPPHILVPAALTLARLRMALGDPGAAHEALNHVAALARLHEDDTALAVLDLGRLLVGVRPGVRDAAAAERSALGTTALRVSYAGAIRQVAEQGDLLVARLLIAGGECRTALALLEELRAEAERNGRGACVLEALVLAAVAQSAAGERSAALAALAEALALAQPEGYLRVFLDEGAPMADLLAATAAPPALRPYRARLLAAFGHPEAHADDGLERGLGGWRRADGGLVEALTAREREVLALLARGDSNQAIAATLILGESTVKWHVRNICAKLGAGNRLQAILAARELGLLSGW